MKRGPFWFRWLAALLPRDFREDHLEDVVELAEHYAAGQSVLRRTWIWLRAAGDMVSVALRGRGRALAGGTGSGSAFDGLMRDVHYGARSLSRDKAWATFAVLIVGLGIGASVTVFSVVSALFLKPLPFESPDELVWVSNGEWGRGQSLSAISVQGNYLADIQERSSQLRGAGGFHLFDRDGDHVLTAGAGPQRVTRLRVSPGLFETLGVHPRVGRLFSAEEVEEDTPSVVLLTHGFWTQAFGGDPAIVGASVTVDGATKTVVGVLPADFSYGDIFAPGRVIDYVEPWALSPRNFRTGNTVGIVARLADGATIASAQDEMDALAAAREAETGDATEERPYWLNDFYPIVRPLRDHVTSGFAPMTTALVGAVLLVMLIVCANLSNLLLARGTLRDREMAVRAALGAARGRLIRQMLTEALLLSGVGAAIGTVLAIYGTSLIASLELGIPLLGLAEVDALGLAAAVGAAFTVGLVFGLVPALRASDIRLHEALKEGARGTSRGRGQARLRNALVVGEIALASVLLVASALTVQSLMELLSVDLGYAPEHVVAVRIDPPVRFESDQARDAHYTAILNRVREAPGISAVGTSDILPMGFNRMWGTRILDQPDTRISPFVRVVSEGYLETIGASITLGRDVASSDDLDSPGVALVNQTFASIVWPGENPIGRMVRTNGEREIVGVVEDTRLRSVDQESGPELYVPIRQLREHGSVHLMVRGDRPTEELVGIVQDRVRSVDGAVALDGVVTLGDVVDRSLASRRFLVSLMAGFALFALVLASLGTYSVISYSVAQRRREIGVHIALGASSSTVTGRVVRDTVRLTLWGLVLGLAAAAYVTRFVEGLLYQTPRLDPTAYVATAVVLGGVALLAGFLPARRAAATSPTLVLAGEGGGTG
ncbi:MAG: ABC transporter permease [Gemmatimonadota bacterium]